MRVCHIVPSLEARHGGPSKSVRALANAQATSGDSVELLTTFEAGHAVVDGIGEGASVRSFPRIFPRWLSRSPDLRRHLSGVSADCIHNHALWLRPLHYAHEAAQRLEVPLVISPRGMMSGWAYRHRQWRKRLATLLVHPGALAAAAGWHATSKEEADDIRGLGFRQPVCVAPNGVTLPTEPELADARATWHDLCPAARSRPVALFYSRLHRKKRVKELIQLWQAAPRGDWLLLIVGVAEDYTVAELNATVAAAGATDSIHVFDGADRPPPYAVASLFLLPSHSENFGLVILEALAASVPVVVTDTTPWAKLATEGCGWCLPWADYPAALDTALTLRPDEREAMGRRGRAWAKREFSWTSAAHLLTEFYRHLRHEHA